MRRSLIRSAVLLGAASVVAACASPPAIPPVPVGTVASHSAATRQLVSSSTAASPGPITVRKASLPDLACASSTEDEITAPLAVYGDLDSATLNFAAGPPPAAVLCGTFTSGGLRQHGSATSTSGHLANLFSKINPTKVSSGGGYYWIAGAVDASVVLSFPETPNPSRVDLVPLTTGWRGFVFEYSPGRTLSAPPGDASVNVSALDKNGAAVDVRHIDLDTGAVRQIRPAAGQPQQTR